MIDVVNNQETTYLLAPKSEITSYLDYLALGDSYTSGEGAFYYRPGTDTATNECHNSQKSYPALLINSLFTAAGGNSVACSGAVISDLINNDQYTGQAGLRIAERDRARDEIERYLTNFDPGYLPQINFVGHHQPAALTVSIGGNDIGFGNILKICAAPHLSRHLSAVNDCFATYEDRLELAQTIDSQIPRLTRLYKKLQSMAPASTIYAIGYPQIAVDNGNCALNVRLNTSELALSIEIISELNNAVARAATASGISYVDIGQALAGHRLCENTSDRLAMHGVTAGNDAGPVISAGEIEYRVQFLGKESFHPNAYGYELIAEYIRARTEDLRLKSNTPDNRLPATDQSKKILKAPASGRKVVTKQPSKVTAKKAVKKGGTLKISVKGRAKGLKPNSPYKVSLPRGETPTDLGTIVSSDDADLEGTLILLPIVQPGPHEISIIGEDQLGNPTDIIDVIDVIHSENDYDGDGIINDKDSCLTIYNSGEDQDLDGIDDACDPVVGTPPANQPPSSAPVGQSPGSDGNNINAPTTVNPPEPSALQVAPVNNALADKLIVASPVSARNLDSTISPNVLGVAASKTNIRFPPATVKPPEAISDGRLQRLPRIPWLHLLIIYLLLIASLDMGRRLIEKYYPDLKSI